MKADGTEKVVSQGISHIQKIRRHSRDAQFQKHLDEIIATIKLLQASIESRNELIDALQEERRTLEQILQQDFPEVWKTLQPPKSES